MVQFAAISEEPRTKYGSRQLTHLSSDALNSWTAVVKEFSSRNLRVPTDQLPALSSMAEKYTSLIGARYISGIWEISQLDLTSQLLWDNTHITGCRMADNAPSWLWASIRGRVSFLDWKEHAPRILWIIGDINFRPNGLNRYGSGSGSVSIEGPAIWLLPHWDPKNQFPEYFNTTLK